MLPTACCSCGNVCSPTGSILIALSCVSESSRLARRGLRGDRPNAWTGERPRGECLRRPDDANLDFITAEGHPRTPVLISAAGWQRVWLRSASLRGTRLQRGPAAAPVTLASQAFGCATCGGAGLFHQPPPKAWNSAHRVAVTVRLRLNDGQRGLQIGGLGGRAPAEADLALVQLQARQSSDFFAAASARMAFCRPAVSCRMA